MKTNVAILLLALLLILRCDFLLAQQEPFTASSKLNMVASVHPLATDAGIAAFDKGGNAVDAAIATAITLGVVDSFNSGIGGGCFILIRTADGNITAIDGREMAPAAATRDMYLRDGKADGTQSTIGPLASATPGALAAYARAIQEHGRLKLNDLIEPAAEIAARGFRISQVHEKKIKSVAQHLDRFEATKSVLMKADGSLYQTGDLLKQAELANTYYAIGKHGLDWFYKGPFAKRTAAWMKQHGGILTAADFADYKTFLRQPIRTNYREFEIIGFPPPSSGGIHVAQILNILESFDLAAMHSKDPNQLKHVVAEAMKLAFADRAHWLGDSDFVKVPLGLIDKSYALELARKIDTQKTTLVKSHGTPPEKDTKFFGKHTTHLCAADKKGNWVSITTTINTEFGSKVIVPGLGVVMNNQMDDFSIAPGTPNVFGLVGGENNSIAPGKRPLSSMSPTIVLKNGQPILAVGAAGGPKIITQVVWAIINHLDLKMPIGQALAASRIHHQWSPDRLRVEDTMPQGTIGYLKSRGHTIESSDVMGISQAISFSPQTGRFVGVHDPRTPGKASGQNAPAAKLKNASQRNK